MVGLEEGLKHLSDNYTSLGHDDESCETCKYIYELLNKYDFDITKTWDYDD